MPWQFYLFVKLSYGLTIGLHIYVLCEGQNWGIKLVGTKSNIKKSLVSNKKYDMSYKHANFVSIILKMLIIDL